MELLESKIFSFFHVLHLNPGVWAPLLVTAIWALIGYLISRHLELVPGRLQTGIELLLDSVHSILKPVLGPAHALELVPFFTTLFIYLLSANMIGLIPGLKSPTSIFSNCLGMALIIFCATHVMGLYKKGFGYIAHFWGEPLWLGPLMFPLHIIGELVRPLSLTLRLFGNIMGEDIVLLVLLVFTIPWVLPLPMMAFAIFTSVLQALVFTMLSTVYVSQAMAPDHH
ncbi:MAG TPA: F0F1 ATP synthase subunit A [Candidatus Ozemobacteraceae bacterium]|nr:F0F1 ATP synthase subunit A [Candidatus Ozemobacteraceae bacterium]